MGTTEDKVKIICGLNSEVRNDGGLECQGNLFFFWQGGKADSRIWVGTWIKNKLWRIRMGGGVLSNDKWHKQMCLGAPKQTGEKSHIRFVIGDKVRKSS